MIKLSVGGLPASTTEQSLTELFSQYGAVRSMKLQKDIFTGACRGFANLSMEGHEARAAIAALDGAEFEGRNIRVGLDKGRKSRNRRR